MSGKLDQSLDEILSTHRSGPRTRRGGRPAGRGAGRAAATAAPVGGVKKSTKAVGGAKAVPTGPSSRNSEGKISVSNLPKDVNEAQIKEYFGSSVGPIKRVELQYGPNGASRGKATVIFARADSASKALKELNGLLVDNRPMIIEMIVDAKHAPSIPAPKGLGERIQPKAQPKSAANTKATTAGAKGAEGRGKGAARGRGAKGRGGRTARPAKKTAEELDSEMADYFDNGNTANAETAPATNGAPATTSGDAMDEEVL